MKFAQGTPKEEADRLVAEWLSGIKQPGKGKGNLQSGGLNWDYSAYGGSGFGGKDIDEMKKRDFSPYQIRAAYEEAKGRGLNVGPRAEQEASAGWASIPRKPVGLPDARPQSWGERWPGDGGPTYGDKSVAPVREPARPVSSPPDRPRPKPSGGGRNWDYEAHGQAGFGGADFRAMRRSGHNDDQIRNAIGEARRQGRNVGRKVQQWESGGGAKDIYRSIGTTFPDGRTGATHTWR